MRRFVQGLVLALALICGVGAQNPSKAGPSPAESAIIEKMRGLRKVSDQDRPEATTQLAIQIRALPVGKNKVNLAMGLAALSTEGDFGHHTLQEVADTLSQALSENPIPDEKGQPYPAYAELAELAKYENVSVSLSAASYNEAISKVAETERVRGKADFTLSDLDGKQWTLSKLRGNVVVVNFWATWCPPCRKEMPDLGDLYEQFKSKGFVILAISDELKPKVQTYVTDKKVPYTVLLDPGRKVNDAFRIDAIPKTFVYDRKGKLVAQAIDMRTRGQLLAMLDKAGLK